MKVGPLVTALVVAGALVGVVGAFATNASPYVTVTQARASESDRLHLAGTILKDTVKVDVMKRTLSFRLKDDEGQVIQVVHDGELPANFAEAPKVVAVGGVKNGVFRSSQLILKCPTKYNDQEPASGA